MLAKKDKTPEVCKKAVEASFEWYNYQIQGSFVEASGFLYAKENDELIRHISAIDRLMEKAKLRAERELDAKPKRRIPPPVDLSKIPDFDPTDKWGDVDA